VSTVKRLGLDLHKSAAMAAPGLKSLVMLVCSLSRLLSIARAVSAAMQGLAWGVN